MNRKKTKEGREVTKKRGRITKRKKKGKETIKKEIKKENKQGRKMEESK